MIRAHWPILALSAALGLAQNASQTFEVASVRPTAPEVARTGTGAVLPLCFVGNVQVDPGRFTATNVTLYTLITWAYGIRYSCHVSSTSGLVSGGPDWVVVERFDIQASMPSGSPRYTRQQLLEAEAPQLQAMLRDLLAERFKLIVRRDRKEMPVHVLSAAAGGLKLPASSEAEPERARLGLEVNPSQELMVRINGNKATMEDFTHVIEPVTHTPVLNRTAFTGDFRFDATFADIDLVSKSTPERIAEIGALGQFTPATQPSIFKVLQEQFGLRLEAARAPVDVWWIVRAEKPGEN